jgi:hypothetical protein
MNILDDISGYDARTAMQTTRCPYARCDMVLAVALPYFENEELVKEEIARTINRHLEQTHGWTLLQFQEGKLQQARSEGYETGRYDGVKEGRYLERRDWIDAMRSRNGY